MTGHVSVTERERSMVPSRLTKLVGSDCPITTCPGLYGHPGGYWVQGTRLTDPGPDGRMTVEVPTEILDEFGTVDGPAVTATGCGTYIVEGEWVGTDGHALLTAVADHETAVHVPPVALFRDIVTMTV